jgi:hypothetical protein
VRVGDTVEHEWSCHGVGQAAAQQEQQEQRMAGLFGLLVHDCFVDDGKSRRAQVVDSRGCSLDPLILPTPIYTENALRATVLSAVAKFPDGDLIGFQASKWGFDYFLLHNWFSAQLRFACESWDDVTESLFVFWIPNTE